MAPLKRVVVELSPYSVQLAIIAGRQLVACGEYALDAKEALAAFLEANGVKEADVALIAPRSLFAHRAGEAEAGQGRSPAELLGYAQTVATGFAPPLAAVACDTVTGKPVEEAGQSPWLLAGTTAEALTAAREQLSALGVVSVRTGLALPAQLGAVVVALQDMPESTRVAVLTLGENASVLALVSAGGVEAVQSVPTGYAQIFEAVQAELGLKFRAAAAKLFFNEAYEFGEAAGKIAGRIAGAVTPVLAGLEAKAGSFHVLGLPAKQAWFGRELAQAAGSLVWAPESASLCAHLGLETAPDLKLTPGALGLASFACEQNLAQAAWLPAWLDANSKPPAASTPPPPAAAPARVTVRAATDVKTAPAKTVAASASVAAKPAAKPVKAAVTAPTPVKAAASPAKAAPVPVAANPEEKKKNNAVLYGVIGAVVLAAVVGGVMMLGSRTAAPVAQAVPLPPVAPAVPAKKPEPVAVRPQTVAYFRFENGVPGRSANGLGTIIDTGGGGHNLNGYKGPVYSTDVPVAVVPGIGETNVGSVHFTAQNDIYSPPNEGLSQVVFNSFTIEAYVRFESLEGWQTFIGRDDSLQQPEAPEHKSLMYFSKTTNQPAQSIYSKNGFRIEVITNHGIALAVNSSVAPVAGSWYHVAAVGDVEKGTLSLYVDGKLAGRTNGFTGLLTPHSGNGSWTFGRGQFRGKTSDKFLGDLDEVRFSNGPLSPEQFLNASPAGAAR
ncbi:MAG: LamG domain-containing protein [Verrucomicrobia bacterium]|nr:LamG domain-containing protein [Verrucomicrobiota bacterium]